MYFFVFIPDACSGIEVCLGSGGKAWKQPVYRTCICVISGAGDLYVSLSGIIQILYEQPDFDQIIISYDV